MMNQIEQFINVDKRKETPYVLSQEHIDFWSGYPPEEIILASASIRKDLMLEAQKNDFSFHVFENGKKIVITEPGDLRDYFNRNIANGNGALKEKTFLGYLYGVPLFSEPSMGETDSNEDPYQESVNKVVDLREKYRGQNILIFSTDTVDRPNLIKSPLGKPENDPDFPKKEEFILSGNFDEIAYDQEVIDYLEEYKRRFYTGSAEMIHTNAIAVLNTLNGEIIDVEHRILELRIKIDQKKLEDAKASPDVGGGGISQQLADYSGVAIMESYFDEFALSALPGYDIETLRMALYCQIAGMPYAIIEILRLAQEKFANSLTQQGS